MIYEDYTLYLQFNDGTEGNVDIADLVPFDIERRQSRVLLESACDGFPGFVAQVVFGYVEGRQSRVLLESACNCFSSFATPSRKATSTDEHNMLGLVE